MLKCNKMFSNNSTKRARILASQKIRLVELVANFFIRKVGRCFNVNGIEINKENWQSFAKILNSMGPSKDASEWKTSFNTMKSRVRSNMLIVHEYGGTAEANLTEVDQKIYEMFPHNSNFEGVEKLPVDLTPVDVLAAAVEEDSIEQQVISEELQNKKLISLLELLVTPNNANKSNTITESNWQFLASQLNEIGPPKEALDWKIHFDTMKLNVQKKVQMVFASDASLKDHLSEDDLKIYKMLPHLSYPQLYPPLNEHEKAINENERRDKDVADVSNFDLSNFSDLDLPVELDLSVITDETRIFEETHSDPKSTNSRGRSTEPMHDHSSSGDEYTSMDDHISELQNTKLIDLLEHFFLLAVGRNSKVNGVNIDESTWNVLVSELNTMGPSMSALEWKIHLSDLKSNVRSKVKKIFEKDGIPENNLSEREFKIYKMFPPMFNYKRFPSEEGGTDFQMFDSTLGSSPDTAEDVENLTRNQQQQNETNRRTPSFSSTQRDWTKIALRGTAIRGRLGTSIRGKLTGTSRFRGADARGKSTGSIRGKLSHAKFQATKTTATSYDEDFTEEFKRVSDIQKERLIQLVQNNFLKTVGRFSGSNGVGIKRQLWETFACELNTLGPSKTVQQWKNCLDYIKGSAKMKLAVNRSNNNEFGRGSKALTRLEEKLISVYGIENLDGQQGLGEGGFNYNKTVVHRTQDSILNKISDSSQFVDRSGNHTITSDSNMTNQSNRTKNDKTTTISTITSREYNENSSVFDYFPSCNQGEYGRNTELNDNLNLEEISDDQLWPLEREKSVGIEMGQESENASPSTPNISTNRRSAARPPELIRRSDELDKGTSFRGMVDARQRTIRGESIANHVNSTVHENYSERKSLVRRGRGRGNSGNAGTNRVRNVSISQTIIAIFY